MHLISAMYISNFIIFIHKVVKFGECNKIEYRCYKELYGVRSICMRSDDSFVVDWWTWWFHSFGFFPVRLSCLLIWPNLLIAMNYYRVFFLSLLYPYTKRIASLASEGFCSKKKKKKQIKICVKDIAHVIQLASYWYEIPIWFVSRWTW